MNGGRFSKSILQSAFEQEATDVHFCPELTCIGVYFRIHGKRVRIQTISLSQYQPLLTFLKFSSGMDIGEIRRPQDGRMEIQDRKYSYSLRLSTLPSDPAESLAIRILPQSKKIPFEQLFLFPNQASQLIQFLKHKSGIFLLTGPTGSGKTTTLYGLLQTLLMHHASQVISLEDPIEQELEHVTQIQINEKADLSYQAGLKAALRHDPDVLMIGEIRDQQTARLAFHAAYTGHLVLSTLHAKNTVGTIHRLLEFGLKPVDLHQVLISVASIELLPLLHHANRAAILEILTGDALTNAINRQPFQLTGFPELRRKAYACGYIDQELIP
ncbi:Flp pilus assembly complex ATPase component TadA [Radiobacillus kanasensis]|uniref:competence type IV pilus ATPase ComGA n=1 Tax=Radiobacillus kanasensis TaxID=2844358 RepID=UPI001E33F1DB|nr:competence type IV pilus ATPase ComGA [Radiobacillus kanasensis]UFT97765.1 Flp pilus assembly complex ATPase component TadA [Radiobacillus kanasensis]